MKKFLLYLYLLLFCLLLFLSGTAIFAPVFFGRLQLNQAEINQLNLTYPFYFSNPELELKLKGAYLLWETPEQLVLQATSPQVAINYQSKAGSALPAIYLKNLRARECRVSGAETLQIESPTGLSVTLPANKKRGGRGEIKISWQPPEGEAFSFLVCGDPHWGWSARKEILPQILKAAGSENALFLIILGDLSASGRADQFKALQNLLENSPIPVYTLIGNHDLMRGGGGGGGRELYLKYFGPCYSAFSLGEGGWKFIFADTASGLIYPKEQDWLKQELDKTDSSPCLFFAHIPPWDPRPYGYHCFHQKAEADKLMEILAKANPAAAFFAHIHGAYRFKKAGIPFYLSGGSGAPLVGNPQKHGFFHYLRVEVSGEKAKVQVKKIPSPGAKLTTRLLNRIMEPLAWELSQRRGLKWIIYLVTLLMLSGLISLIFKKSA